MTVYITDSIKQSFIQSLKTLISYPSVLQEGENGTPFGQAIQDVLEKTLEICRELGFKTYIDPKGYSTDEGHKTTKVLHWQLSTQ